MVGMRYSLMFVNVTIVSVAFARASYSSHACADVQRELNVAIAQGESEFQLPSGDIDCPVDFLVFGAQDLAISGAPDGSTTFWFDPRMAGFRIMNGRNVTVRNVAIDHNPLPYIQLEITNITRNSSGAPAYEFQLGVRSLPLEKLDGSWGAISQWWLWSGVGAERWVKESPPFELPKYNMFAHSSGGGYRSLPGFPELGSAEQGDALTMMLRQYHTYTIGNSSRVTNEDITIYSSKGLNFYELDGEGGHTYRRLANKRRDGQLISSNADCFHSIDVEVGPLLEDSELAYCLDDFFNIHNTIHVLLPAASANPLAHGDFGATRAVLVNPRIGVGSNTPDDASENSSTLDQWYGDTSPMTNVRAGVDTLLCRTFSSDVENGPNTQRFGGPVKVLQKKLVTDPSRTSLAAKDALVKQLEDHAHIRFVSVDRIEVWDIELSSDYGWNTTADPALICDIERFLAKGSVIRNNRFHHTTCNMGRTKSSDSVIENNTFAYARDANLEITGLEQWMEGPMVINNVSIVNNLFVGTPEGNRNVHPSAQATNITMRGNLPLPRTNMVVV